MKRNTLISFLPVLLAAITSLPFVGGILGGIYIWLSPNVMLTSVLALRSMVALNLLGIITLLLCAFKKRFFCNYLCPTGWCCRQISKNATKDYTKRIPSNVGKYLAIVGLTGAVLGFPLFLWIDPVVLFCNFGMIFSVKAVSFSTFILFALFPLLLLTQWWFPHSWCSKVCPLGGFQDILSQFISLFQMKKPGIAHTKTGITRREWLAAFSGFAAGGFLITRKFVPDHSLLPPASLASPQFETLCLRCGNCVRVCPTHIIRRNEGPVRWYAWMTPKIDMTESYCLSDCNLCGTVCPSGAITPFELSAKKILRIGTALINTDECLLNIPEECDRCKNACVYQAIEIKIDKTHFALPVVNKDRCVGCGACMHICPPEIIQIHPVLYHLV